MKTVQKILAFIGLLSLCALFVYAIQEAPTDENFEKKLINDYNVYALQIPENLEGIKLATDKRKNIFLIFKETVNNAVKYSKCNSLNIQFAYLNNYLKLTVSDNGQGFDQQAEKTGNGLKNIADRAKNINATLNISSRPGYGTTIELRCPV